MFLEDVYDVQEEWVAEVEASARESAKAVALAEKRRKTKNCFT